MGNKYTVCVDWDDILCQCNEYLLKLLYNDYHKYYKMSQLTKWGPLGDKILDSRFRYMESEDFHRDAPMYPGAKSFIYELMRMGCCVLIMTSVPARQAGMRVSRILKEFPDFDPGNILIGSRKDLMHVDFILDDASHNIIGSNATYPVLFRRPWNAHCTGLMAVNDYQSFLTLVRSIMYPQEKTQHDGPLVLVGPTGSGKTAIANELLDREDFERVVSYTTRQKRDGEPENAYVFVLPEEFEQLEKEGAFVEMTSYGNKRYGSSKKDIDSILDRKHIPVMVLDICGAVSVKQHYPNATLVFIERDKESCFRSLLERNLSIDENVNRLASFDAELRNRQFCDVVIKNNDRLELVAHKIISLITI